MFVFRKKIKQLSYGYEDPFKIGSRGQDEEEEEEEDPEPKNFLQISWKFQSWLSMKIKYVYISKKILTTLLWVWRSN